MGLTHTVVLHALTFVPMKPGPVVPLTSVRAKDDRVTDGASLDVEYVLCT